MIILYTQLASGPVHVNNKILGVTPSPWGTLRGKHYGQKHRTQTTLSPQVPWLAGWPGLAEKRAVNTHGIDTHAQRDEQYCYCVSPKHNTWVSRQYSDNSCSTFFQSAKHWCSSRWSHVPITSLWGRQWLVSLSPFCTRRNGGTEKLIHLFKVTQ